MKKMKKFLALTMAAAMAISMAGCGSGNAGSNGQSSDANEGDAKYTIGICQLVEHVALDAATEGFMDAVKE